jgi:hypothetical protein
MTDESHVKAGERVETSRYVRPEWNWSDPALRAQLRIGTVLETDDFGYIRVIDVTADGVVSLGGSFPRHLWKWDELTQLKCTIHVQPDEASGADTLNWNVSRIGNRGGVLTLSTLAGNDTHPDVPTVEQALGSELTRLAPPSLMRMELHARVRTEAAAEHGSAPLAVSISTNTGDHLKPNAATRTLVARLRDFLLECQGSTWTELRFGVWRVDATWRYNADYEYE